MKFSALRIENNEMGVVLKNGPLTVANITSNGHDGSGRYEADALEAAELLKAFFEAKAAGKAARLFVNEGELHGWQDAVLSYPKPEGPTVTKMDTQEAKALLDRLPDLIWNRATDRAADTTKLEYARILIGQWAATIQAQNIALAPDDCFERAFEIWTSSQLVDAKRLLP